MQIPFLNFHTHKLDHDPKVFSITNSPCENSKPICYGLHPWFIDEDWLLKLDEIKSTIQKNTPLMIGEIGLDKLRGPTFDIQYNAMIAQLKIAVDFDLACVIHSVKSYSECLAIRKQWKNKCRPWVFHDFNSNEQMASAIIKSGCYLSLSPRMIKHYEMNPKKYSYLETLDLDFIFLETDDDLKINILDMFTWFSSLRDIDIHTLNNKFWKNLELITGKNYECILAESCRASVTR